MLKRKILQGLLCILFLALFAAAAAGVAYLVYRSGHYPQGKAALYHIYRADQLLSSIRTGDYFPLYDANWYNGVEPLRYFSPLTAYMLVLCGVLAGQNVLQGYFWYLAILFFLGAAVWLYVGIRKKRLLMGAFLGLLWFFMPANLTACFGEGDLARGLVIALLPLLLYLIVSFLDTRRFFYMPFIMICYLLMLLSHTGYTGMVTIAMVFYLLLDKFINKRKRGALAVCAAFVISWLLTGVWLYPFLRGGLTAVNNERIMRTFFQSGLTSLNPLHRLEVQDAFYFGLAAFILAVFGAVCSKRKSMPGFWSGILIFACTTLLFYPLISRIPGHQYLWMLRFLSIAAAMILFSFLLWDSLKTWIVLLVSVLLVLDVLPSVPLLYGGIRTGNMDAELTALSEDTLIAKAKEITTQRLAMLDAGLEGAAPHYVISDFGERRLQESFGYGWQAAETADNVSMLEEALSEGAYLYLFDRCLELGDDTVLIPKSMMKKEGEDEPYLKDCAVKRGYALVEENPEYLLYHYNTGMERFGTVNYYRGIGIGTNSSQIELYYPIMEEGESDCLTDYTFDELKDYEIIFLDHFTYEDKETAEQLIRDLADAQVRIVINADGIPINGLTKVREFLGINCSRVLFENGYPFLFVGDKRYDLDFFREGYEDWETVFVNHLDEVEGYFYDNGLEESFLGKVYNDNITVIGLNLIYHTMLTGDPNAKEILDSVIRLNPEELPQRELVPIRVAVEPRRITIETDREGVNTNLAFHDIFESAQPIRSVNHLLEVGKGRTVITLRYPYLRQGLVISLIGLLSAVLFLAVGKISFDSDLEKEKEERKRKEGTAS